jgi:uncharacterized protein (TIGR02145 family)
MLIVLGWVCLGQSKKEQIRVLSNRVDSLNLVLNSERTDYSQRVEQLNGRISELEEKVRGLEIKLKEKDSENEINKKQIEELRKLINVKSDSLMVLKAEIEKLKPTPKPVVQNNPVVSNPSGPDKSVTIGTQVWMKENLNVSTFRNGEPIPEAKTAEEWKAAGEAKQPAWCYYDNDPKNGAKYGKLYNWYAVNDPRGIAPVGWHVPNNSEWDNYKNYFNNFYNGELDEIKSKSGWKNKHDYKICNNCKNWNSAYKSKNSCHVCKDEQEIKINVNGNGTNSSGFNAFPGGYRDNWLCSWCHSKFYYSGERAFYWSYNNDTEDSKGWSVEINAWNFFNGQGTSEGLGLSVRCIKD